MKTGYKVGERIRQKAILVGVWFRALPFHFVVKGCYSEARGEPILVALVE